MSSRADQSTAITAALLSASGVEVASQAATEINLQQFTAALKAAAESSGAIPPPPLPPVHYILKDGSGNEFLAIPGQEGILTLPYLPGSGAEDQVAPGAQGGFVPWDAIRPNAKDEGGRKPSPQPGNEHQPGGGSSGPEPTASEPASSNAPGEASESTQGQKGPSSSTPYSSVQNYTDYLVKDQLTKGAEDLAGQLLQSGLLDANTLDSLGGAAGGLWDQVQNFDLVTNGLPSLTSFGLGEAGNYLSSTLLSLAPDAGVMEQIGAFALKKAMGEAVGTLQSMARKALSSAPPPPPPATMSVMAFQAAVFGSPTLHGGMVEGLAKRTFITGPLAARVYDPHVCGFPLHPPNIVIDGVPNTFIEGQPATTVKAFCACGAVITMGAPTVFIGGPLTRYAPLLTLADPDSCLAPPPTEMPSSPKSSPKPKPPKKTPSKTGDRLPDMNLDSGDLFNQESVDQALQATARESVASAPPPLAPATAGKDPWAEVDAEQGTSQIGSVTDSVGFGDKAAAAILGIEKAIDNARKLGATLATLTPYFDQLEKLKDEFRAAGQLYSDLPGVTAAAARYVGITDDVINSIKGGISSTTSMLGQFRVIQGVGAVFTGISVGNAISEGYNESHGGYWGTIVAGEVNLAIGLSPYALAANLATGGGAEGSVRALLSFDQGQLNRTRAALLDGRYGPVSQTIAQTMDSLPANFNNVCHMVGGWFSPVQPTASPTQILVVDVPSNAA